MTQKFQEHENAFVEKLGGLFESKLADIGKINVTTTNKAYPEHKSLKKSGNEKQFKMNDQVLDCLHAGGATNKLDDNEEDDKRIFKASLRAERKLKEES